MHLNLGAVDAVECAVEFGAVEGGIDILVEASLAGDDAAGRSKGGFGFGSLGKIGGKLSAGAGNCAGKGIINRTQLGRFEAAVVSRNSFIDIGHTHVELLGEVGGTGGAIID